MFELRTHFIGARAPLLPADSRVLIDICNRLTTPCVTIPPRPAHPLSDDGRTVDTMRPYSPPSRDFWIPGIREMGHRILEEVDTDPEDARVFKRARRETPPPTPPNAPPPPDEETDLP